MLENVPLSKAHLPFAGITLFRFYGCDLSLQLRKHPGIYKPMPFEKTARFDLLQK
jgi:hypothetical protein